LTTASFPFQNAPTANLPGLHMVVGRFKPNTDGSNTPEVISGKGYTVARQNTGIYRVTFARKVRVMTFVANIGAPSPTLVPGHKAIADANNYVDVTLADFDGNLSDAAQDTELVDFIAMVMSPATGHPDV
jgi:hypothetical protein